MSQITGNLVINDGAATPVAHNFAPVQVAPDNSVFAEKSTGVSAGFINLGVKFSPASASRATNRVDIELSYPVLSTVNGVSTVAYRGLFKGYFVLPDQMTAAERANLAAYVANALDNSIVRGVIKDLDPMY